MGPMVRLKVYHTHRLDTTAPLTTNSQRRRIQTGDQPMALFLTAQISMRDSLSLMARPRLFHTHRSDTIAPANTKWPRRRMSQTGVQPMDPFHIAQISMRDSPSPMARPEPCHTHRLDTTAPLSTNSARRRTSLPTSLHSALPRLRREIHSHRWQDQSRAIPTNWLQLQPRVRRPPEDRQEMNRNYCSKINPQMKNSADIDI